MENGQLWRANVLVCDSLSVPVGSFLQYIVSLGVPRCVCTHCEPTHPLFAEQHNRITAVQVELLGFQMSGPVIELSFVLSCCLTRSRRAVESMHIQTHTCRPPGESYVRCDRACNSPLTVYHATSAPAEARCHDATSTLTRHLPALLRQIG